MRGQFQQVFTFIMLALLAGATLLLGYRLLGGLFVRQCDVAQSDFMTTMAESVDSYSSYGTLKRPFIPAPCDAQLLCIVNSSNFQRAGDLYSGLPTFAHDNPVIQANVRSPPSPPNSLFIVDAQGTTLPVDFFDGRIDLDVPVLCVSANGGAFSLEFEGRGRSVLVRAQ